MSTKPDPVATLPFNVVDEAVRLLDSASEPWSVQLELRVSGRLDESRLRAALRQAMARHPMTRARQLPASGRARQYRWQIRPEPDLDPLRVLECPDDDALARARAELYSLRVSLAESPPLRVRLARHPAGDLVMLNVNHAAFDGCGCLRVLHSTARAYAGTAHASRLPVSAPPPRTGGRPPLRRGLSHRTGPPRTRRYRVGAAHRSPIRLFGWRGGGVISSQREVHPCRIGGRGKPRFCGWRSGCLGVP